MTNTCLQDFNKKDNLDSYIFESDYIRFLNVEFMGEGSRRVIRNKNKIGISRQPNTKKKRLEFIVWQDVYSKTFDDCWINEIVCMSKEKAKKVFERKVEKFKALQEADNERDIVLDTMERYCWKLNENEKPIEKRISLK